MSFEKDVLKFLEGRISKSRTKRTQFVGAHVTKGVKTSLVKMAEKQDSSVSRIISEILTEVFKNDAESVRASEDRG